MSKVDFRACGFTNVKLCEWVFESKFDGLTFADNFIYISVEDLNKLIGKKPSMQLLVENYRSVKFNNCSHDQLKDSDVEEIQNMISKDIKREENKKP